VTERERARESERESEREKERERERERESTQDGTPLTDDIAHITPSAGLGASLSSSAPYAGQYESASERLVALNADSEPVGSMLPPW
jgi:hypothetical protein